MGLSLDGRVAIVTGGGRGLGRAIALRLAREGASVVIAGPDPRETDVVADEVAATGRIGLALAVDVTRENEIREMAARADHEFGHVDILVNNAGIMGPTAPVGQVALADWDEVLAVNLTGAFLCARAVLPGMIARRSGKIVNIASMAGKTAYALRSPYAVSKWGLIGLTLTLAREVGEHQIQVNAVCPGPVEGDRMRRVIAERASQSGQDPALVEGDYLRRAALGRMVRANDVAAAVAFLASAEADNITGEALDVSAGYAL
jgi:NAD(P)-dependent dehydrogenase (short-subunit alcohol dehydrogenase family)